MTPYLAINTMSLLSLILLISCQNKKPQEIPVVDPSLPTGVYSACKTPRPELCTQDFRPVCAKVDTGVRCVTKPCPSEENKTYSNACTACADPKVYGFWKTACPELLTVAKYLPFIS